MTIQSLNAEEAKTLIPELTELLRDCVNHGAAIGFLAPLSYQEAKAYWLEVIESLRGPNRVLFAVLEDKKVVGSAQLDLPSRPNGLHRAEVMKVMVHTHYRRKGIGKALMQTVEQKARELNRTTLVLDTREGDEGEKLYASQGYSEVGKIPNYARSSDGSLHATMVMYKLL